MKRGMGPRKIAGSAADGKKDTRGKKRILCEINCEYEELKKMGGATYHILS